ncbi:hypothetical protein NG791_23125 [Laspinema sp. D1]|uniref:hypothetical protein n=1 Tax=Laspinema palackyanum TaxID=3231601 RepID=UPI003472279A|nr:hypothetical protein [Laspinema sp. D2b]
MSGKTTIIGTIASLGVVLGMLSGEGIAQNTHETHPTQTQQRSQFHRIEQPLRELQKIKSPKRSFVGSTE